MHAQVLKTGLENLIFMEHLRSSSWPDKARLVVTLAPPCPPTPSRLSRSCFHSLWSFLATRCPRNARTSSRARPLLDGVCYPSVTSPPFSGMPYHLARKPEFFPSYGQLPGSRCRCIRCLIEYCLLFPSGGCTCFFITLCAFPFPFIHFSFLDHCT